MLGKPNAQPHSPDTIIQLRTGATTFSRAREAFTQALALALVLVISNPLAHNTGHIHKPYGSPDMRSTEKECDSGK